MKDMNTLRAPSFRIAVVEDDHHLRHDLIDFLVHKGHDAVGCESAEAFETLQARHPVSLVVLDIGLPGLNGLELVQRLRARPHSPGIVMLTSFNAEETRIQGLQDGADSYLIKNASLELIEATCMSVMRRLVPASTTLATPVLPDTLAAADDNLAMWLLDVTRSLLISPNGGNIELTHTEQVFLQTLLRRPGLAVAREVLLEAMVKPDTHSNARNLDNCATRLRRKVALNTGLELPVRACYGVGYTFGEAGRVLGS